MEIISFSIHSLKFYFWIVFLNIFIIFNVIITWNIIIIIIISQSIITVIIL